MKNIIKFGTDGWRAVISDGFTYDNVRLVAQAISEYLKTNRRNSGLLIGYDNRFFSEKFAEECARILASNDIPAILSKVSTPTPLVSYMITKNRYSGGIMVTASHNPPEFNGIKFKTADGCSSSPETTKQIEKYANAMSKDDVKCLPGKFNSIVNEDFSADYVRLLKKRFPALIKSKSRLKIAIDPMNGSGIGFFENVVRGNNFNIASINARRDVYFAGRNPEPISKNLTDIMKLMKKERYDIGLAFDGDADRIGLIDERGNFVSPQYTYSLLVLHYIAHRNAKSGIGKTICTTSLLDKISKCNNIPLYETPVGFKYQSELLLQNKIFAGGEESGGIGFSDHLPERDGIHCGLSLVEMVLTERIKLSEILKRTFKQFGNHYYRRIDFKSPVEINLKFTNTLKNSPPEKLGKFKIREVKSFDGVKLIFDDTNWILFRASGTEPVLRIYAEAKSRKELNNIFEHGLRLKKRM